MLHGSLAPILANFSASSLPIIFVWALKYVSDVV